MATQTIDTHTHSARGPARASVPAAPLRTWTWLALRGSLALMLGVVAFLLPGSTLFAFTMVFAAFAFVDGLFSLGTGVTGARKKERLWWAQLLRGVIGIAVGVLFVLMPGVATVSYALATLGLTAAWAIVTGIFEMTAAVRLREEMDGKWLPFASGLISVALGLAIPLFLWAYPEATLLSAAWLLGIYAFAAGAVLIAQALRLRRRAQES